MNLSDITQEDWKEFEQSFPRAAAFLLHKSLEGELRRLKNLRQLTRWEAERKIELLTALEDPRETGQQKLDRFCFAIATIMAEVIENDAKRT